MVHEPLSSRPPDPDSRPPDPDSGSPPSRRYGPDRPPQTDTRSRATEAPTACHIALLVADLAAATDFYCHGLGIVADPARSSPTFRALQLGGDLVLGLHTAQSWRELGMVPAAPGAPPQMLVAYRPGSADEVEDLADQLEDLGARVIHGPREAFGQRMALLADRDGHLVCLTHPLPEDGR